MKFLILTVFFIPFVLQSQIKAEINGKVMNATTKEALSDVKIVFFSSSKGTNNTYYTDASGTFNITISVSKGEKIYLTVSKEGFSEFKTAKRVKYDGQQIDITCYLNPDRQ